MGDQANPGEQPGKSRKGKWVAAAILVLVAVLFYASIIYRIAVYGP